MKLVQFEHAGTVSVGVVLGDEVVDVGDRLGTPAAGLRRAIEVFGSAGPPEFSAKAGPALRLDAVRLLPPVAEAAKVIGIGLNYKAHAEELGLKPPAFPSTFSRFADTLVGHAGVLRAPRASSDFDFEGELAVVIGRAGRAIAPERALEHVFGYTCFNDGSIRDFQKQHSLNAGKNFPASAGVGPWIVTRHHVPDPQRLQLTTRLNGEVVQSKSTGDMIFSVAELIAYVSTWTPLSPGDVISTGTPEGVGAGRKPPLWMRAGDTVEVEISGVGLLSNTVAGEAAG